MQPGEGTTYRLNFDERVLRFGGIAAGIFLIVPALTFPWLAPVLLGLTPGWAVNLVVAVVGSGLGWKMICQAQEDQRLSLELGGDSFLLTRASGSVEHALGDFQGFRIDRHRDLAYLALVPRHPAGSEVAIPLFYDRPGEIRQWFAARLPDLDEVEREAEGQMILRDGSGGRTNEEWQRTLRRAIAFARVVTWVSFACSMWGMFRLQPARNVHACLVVLPWVGLALRAMCPRLVVLEPAAQPVREAVPSVILLSGLVLTLRGAIEWNLLQPWALVLPSGILTLVLSGATFLVASELRKRRGAVVSMLTFAALWAVGTCLLLNGERDASVPQRHRAQVLDTRSEGTSPPRLFLTLGPWGPRTQQREERVSRHLFDAHRKGDVLDVYLFEGALGVPWYVLK